MRRIFKILWQYTTGCIELWDTATVALFNAVDNGDNSYTTTGVNGTVSDSILVFGERYIATFTISGYVSNLTGISGGTTTAPPEKFPNANGTFTVEFTHDGTDPTVFKLISVTSGVTFSNISVIKCD